jgi:hypothetical protein
MEPTFGAIDLWRNATLHTASTRVGNEGKLMNSMDFLGRSRAGRGRPTSDH